MYGIKSLSSAIAAACLLAACGGGGGDSTATPADGGGGGGGGGTETPQTAGGPIKGVWTGTATSVVGPRNLTWDTTTVAMEDGRVFLMTSEFYDSPTAPERNLIGGLVVGKGTAADGNYSFTNGQEFPFEDITPEWRQRPAAVSATYTAQTSLDGSINYGEGVNPRSFDTGYASSYSSGASLADLDTVFNNTFQRSIQGVFYTPNPAGGSIRKEVQLVVEENGNLRARSGLPSCQLSGSLTPRTDMKVFDVTITFGDGDCPYPANTTLDGAAFLKPTVVTTRNAQVVENRFHLVATNGNQDQGTVFAQVLLADAPQ